MSEETEISRDFLRNETLFSEDKTNANILKDYISISDENIIKLFGTAVEINKSWPRQVSTNFIKKWPGIKWQDRNPDAEFFTNERSVNEEKTNENAFDEYDSINDEKFMKNQPKSLDSSKEESNVNIIKVDPMKEIPYQMFTQKGHLKEQFEVFHEKKKMHICSNCGVSFGEKSSLKEHISLVHEGKKGLLNDGKCPRCDKQFVDKGNILKHIKAVHEKIKPFNCSVCNADFTEKGGLAMHIKTVHEKKKPYICSICSVAFGQKSILKQHIASVHEGKKPDPTKQRKCSICNKIFSHQGNLSKHTRAVHEGKKFNCDMCEASFWENHALTKHIALSHI